MTRNQFSSLLILLLTIVVGAIVVHLHFYRLTPEVEPVPEVEPIPIHQLLDNEMSNLDETEIFDRQIVSFMRRWELVGGSFALMRGDSLLYAKGYGYADRDRGVLCDVNHVFRVASVSKLITATAIMKLIEQGRISLTSQVYGEEGILCDSMFLDLHSTALERITVEHLLSHTSGLSTPVGDPAFSNHLVAQSLGKEVPLTLDDMVLYSTHYRLSAPAGTRYEYSNLGYMILGKVVEQITQMDYERYVQDSILAPAGCYDMFIGRNFKEHRATNEVDYYEVKEAELVEAYDGSGRLTLKSDGGNDVHLLGSAGGWVVSPTELLRFVAAIDGCPAKPDILTPESIALMTSDNPHRKPMGWATIHGDVWLRSGSMAGTTALIKHESSGYTWAFVTNSSAWIAYLLSNKISQQISQSLTRVKEWPKRDLFEVVDSTAVPPPVEEN